MSAEPGKLATSALDVSAAGNTVPYSIFRRVKFRAHFLNGVPAEMKVMVIVLDGCRRNYL
jgi:hypothetical protein